MVSPRAVIAEDEPLLREQLQRRLREAWPELDIAAVAEDGAEALRAIRQHQPDVAFLDIQMPELTGLEVAREAKGLCHVVFITAYDQYAVDAFEQAAVDYLLKPLAANRLAETVVRLKARLAGPPGDLSELVARIEARLAPATAPHLRWVTVSVGANLKMIAVEDICYFQSDEKYTRVVTVDSESLIRKPIKELIDELDPRLFWQVHRSTLVNVNAIASVARELSGTAEIRLKARGERLPVSRAFVHLFKQM